MRPEVVSTVIEVSLTNVLFLESNNRSVWMVKVGIFETKWLNRFFRSGPSKGLSTSMSLLIHNHDADSHNTPIATIGKLH